MNLHCSNPAGFFLCSYAQGKLHQGPLRWSNQDIIERVQRWWVSLENKFAVKLSVCPLCIGSFPRSFATTWFNENPKDRSCCGHGACGYRKHYVFSLALFMDFLKHFFWLYPSYCCTAEGERECVMSTVSNQAWECSFSERWPLNYQYGKLVAWLSPKCIN